MEGALFYCGVCGGVASKKKKKVCFECGCKEAHLLSEHSRCLRRRHGGGAIAAVESAADVCCDKSGCKSGVRLRSQGNV